MAYSSKGYHKLADLMSNDKDIAILRRFDDLNLLCLLSLQAEILELRQILRRTCFVDDTLGEENEKKYSGNFKLSREDNSEQHKKIKVLRQKLRDYNELLLHVSQINKLNPPQKSQLFNLKGWLNDAKNGFLKDEETHTWHDETESLYLSLATDLEETDSFTEMMQRIIIGPYHRLIGNRFKTGRVADAETGSSSYDKRKIDRASTMIATILSTLFPVLTIFALNSLRTTNARIGVTAAFTLLFALMLARFSSAKRVEIFAATSTFVAVEVVFIGSASSSGNMALAGAVSNGTTATVI